MAKISINLATGTLQKAEIIVGIDLGTTNSLIAFIDPDKNPKVINDTGKGVLVPSIVHFNAAGVPLVGNEAREFLITDPLHTIFSVKRLLGRSYQDVAEQQDTFSYKLIDDDKDSLVKIQAGDKFHSPIELSAEILKELRKRAEHALKTPVNKAVISVPAYFNDSQRQGTREAGRLAGLDVLKIVNESTAASLAYGIGLDPAEQQTIAVYDLGGGTFDVSVLAIQNGIFEVLATNGNTFLAGDDFDRAIVNYWIENNQLDAAATRADSSLMQQLRLKAEEAKKALSSQNLFNEKLGEIWCTLDKQTFENLIASKVAETLQCCKQALADAKLSVADIDEVLMVGGSTRTPYVKAQVAAFFGKQPQDQINPDEVVALGAAIQADILAGNRITHPVSDVAQRTLPEATAEAEQLAYLAGNFIEKNRFILSSIDIAEARKHIEALRAALAQGDKDDILKKTAELNEATRPFAERLMHATASQSIKGKKID